MMSPAFKKGLRSGFFVFEIQNIRTVILAQLSGLKADLKFIDGMEVNCVSCYRKRILEN